MLSYRGSLEFDASRRRTNRRQGEKAGGRGYDLECITLAFSFPNLAEFNPDMKSEADWGKFFELFAFGCRFLELCMEVTFFVLEAKLPNWNPSTKTRAILRGCLTLLQFTFNLIATAIRMDTSSGGEFYAAIVACANVFSSLGEQACSIVAELFLPPEPPAPAPRPPPPPTWGYLLIAAAVFAGVDTLLDAGRGTYEWRSTTLIQLAGANGSPQQGGSHEVEFQKTANGPSEIIKGDLSSTHQVVSY